MDRFYSGPLALWGVVGVGDPGRCPGWDMAAPLALNSRFLAALGMTERKATATANAEDAEGAAVRGGKQRQ